MSKPNRGKDFENVIKKAFEKIDDVSIDRLHDQTSGFKGSKNICDFIVYKYPKQIYLECKCCYGNTLNFHNITDNQWDGLYEKSQIAGVEAGVIIWFIDHDITVYIPIEKLVELKDAGYKSINVKDLPIVSQIIDGTKKRVFFDYDMNRLLYGFFGCRR